MSHIWLDSAQADKAALREGRRDGSGWRNMALQHARWCKRLYVIMAVGAAVLLLGGAFRAEGAERTQGQTNRVPRELLAVQSRTLAELRPGESACTYLGWRVSPDGSVWVKAGEKAELPCQPSVNHALVVRLASGGWLVKVKAPVPVNGWGWGEQGWTKAERVEVVR